MLGYKLELREQIENENVRKMYSGKKLIEICKDRSLFDMYGHVEQLAD